MRYIKIFNVFPAVLKDDEMILRKHWLNSWWMRWFFYAYTHLVFYDMRKRGIMEPMFWAMDDKSRK